MRLRDILVVTAALLAAACSPGDKVGPAQPTLTLVDSARRFEWTATGDDGFAYYALVSDLRYSDQDIGNKAQSLILFANLAVSRQVLNEPSPRIAGRSEFVVAPRIDSLGLYHHLLQIRDEVGNGSPVATLGPAVPSRLVAFNPIQHELRDDLGEPGALSMEGDINDDDLADFVVADAMAGAEKLYVYFGRTSYPYYAVDVTGETPADSVTGTVGLCPSADAQRRRLCAPDLVIDASAIGGRFGGRSALATAQGRPALSLAVSDIDDDEHDEIIVGAPEYEPYGTGEARGAVFVLDFDEDFVSTRQDVNPLLDTNGLLHLFNNYRATNFLGRVTRADSRGVLVDDLLPNDDFPADMTKGVPFDARTNESVYWTLFEGEPIRGFRPGTAITCPVGDTVPCTGETTGVGADFFVFTDDIPVRNIEGKLLLVLLDSATGAAIFSAIVKRIRASEPGVFGAIEIYPHTATPDIATLASAGGTHFALYREIAHGARLATRRVGGIDSGAPGNPIPIGDVLGKWDPDKPASIIRLLDPTAPRVVPDPDNGERYPEITFLGPENGSNFGDVVNAKADLNLDGIPDLAIGAPTLSAAPARYYPRAWEIEERGGVYIVFGDENLNVRDADAQGNLSDGVYDFGPAGIDRPSSLILGRNYQERAGFSVSGVRTRQDNPLSVVRSEYLAPVVFLAIGAPWACPHAPSYSSLADDIAEECGDVTANTRAGAVYLFRANEQFESRDFRLPGGSSDGVWDLAGNPSAELNGAEELAESAFVAAGTLAPTERASVELWGEAPGDQFGFSVMMDSDLNGDHIPDVVVGAPGVEREQPMVPTVRGRIYVFDVTNSEHPFPAFTQLLLGEPARIGAFDSSRTHGFRSRGNIDFNQRVDDNLNGVLESLDDRCIFCVYDLSRPFPSWAAGPDLVLSGTSDLAIGRYFDAGFYNNDSYEDLFVQVESGAGTWLAVLNGMTNLFVRYRNLDLFAPLDSPLPHNFIGDHLNFEIGARPDQFGNGPVGVPGSEFEGLAANAARPVGVTWWSASGDSMGYARVGQVFVNIDAIYEDSISGDISKGSSVDEERIAFGRTETDDEARTTQNTAELLLNFRYYPDNVFRFNVLTHGGLFSEVADPVSDKDEPFVTTLNQFVVGGDHNGDQLADVGMIVNDGELRVAH